MCHLYHCQHLLRHPMPVAFSSCKAGLLSPEYMMGPLKSLSAKSASAEHKPCCLAGVDTPASQADHSLADTWWYLPLPVFACDQLNGVRVQPCSLLLSPVLLAATYAVHR